MALFDLTLRSRFLPFVCRHSLSFIANTHNSTIFRHSLSLTSIRSLSFSSSLKLFFYGSNATSNDSKNDSSKVGGEAAQSQSPRRVGSSGTYVTPDIIQKLQKGEEKRVREWRERNELLKRQVISKNETSPSPAPSKSEPSDAQKLEVKKKRKIINRIFRIPDSDSWRTPKHAWKIGMTFILLTSSINFVLFVLVQGVYSNIFIPTISDILTYTNKSKNNYITIHYSSV